VFLCPLAHFHSKITAVNKTLKYLITYIFRNINNEKTACHQQLEANKLIKMLDNGQHNVMNYLPLSKNLNIKTCLIL
jgi:hypothetical protein